MLLDKLGLIEGDKLGLVEGEALGAVTVQIALASTDGSAVINALITGAPLPTPVTIPATETVA